MPIGPHADQLALRDTVRDVLVSKCPPSYVRQTHTDDDAWQQLWVAAVDLGWTSFAIRRTDSADDLGLTTLDLVLVLEACGEMLGPIPLVSSVGMAAGVAREGGDRMGPLLADIAEGKVACLAAMSPSSRLPGVTMRIEAGRIHGSAVAVTDAVHSELLVTLCSDGDATHIAVVRAGEGVRVEPTHSADPSRPLAHVHVDAPLELSAPADVEAALAPALLALAAELVGVAQGVLNLSVDHARNRTQFGRPIGSYQGVKHALADNHVSVERARSLSYLAAGLVDDDASTAAQKWNACALAKAAAGDAAQQCTRTAIQVFGALGQTWEHDAHLYLRRAWVGASQLADSSSLYFQQGQRFMAGERS